MPVLTGSFVAAFDKQHLDVALFCSSLGILGLIAGVVVALTVKPIYVLSLTVDAEDIKVFEFYKEEVGQEVVSAIRKGIAQHASARAFESLMHG